MSSKTSRRKAPTRDSVTTINEDGSRYVLHPSDTHGRFTSGRRWVAGLLLLIYIALPWIPIGGQPAVFLDLAERRFHLFGFTFIAQDAWLMFFVITGLAFSLFFITSLFGRIWCGWTCPYTVFLEHVYRRVERLIEGDGPKRRQLDNAPWTGSKIAKRTLKHAIFVLISLLLANIFLSYFVSIPGLYEMMHHTPMENFKSFAVVLFFAGGFYFCFAIFREQFCIIMCPYGRIQSALTDENTLVVGYDEERGEPRGHAKSGATGDCIDCMKCVQVCPTGIDIRGGMQIECVGCSNCIDACNDIMDKVERPRGLIRYDSLVGLSGGKTRWLRPRIILYTVLCCFGIIAMSLALSSVRSYQVSVTRMPGAPFYLTETDVRNQYRLRIGNKNDEPIRVDVTALDLPEGTKLLGTEESLIVKPYGELQFSVLVEVPRPNYTGPFTFQVVFTPETGQRPVDRKLKFSGPLSLPAATTPSPKSPPTKTP